MGLEQRNEVEEPSLREAFKQAWVPALATVFCYALAFTLFPGTPLKPGIDFIESNSWETWYIVTMFNVFDMTARFISPVLLRYPQRTIYIFVYSASILFVTTYLLALQIEPASIFQADWARSLNTAGLGFSHGLTSIVLVLVPMNCSEKQKGKGGELGGVSLLLGVCIGCLLAQTLMCNIV